MSIREDLSLALKQALKDKEQVKMATVRLILAALKDRDITARGNGKEAIEENEILSMLQSMIKQRKESAKTYADAGRPELAEREEAEIVVIEGFLPKQMNDNEVDAAVSGIITEVGAASIKDMGKVMGELKSRYAGQMDMAKVGGLVKEKLSA